MSRLKIAALALAVSALAAGAAYAEDASLTVTIKGMKAGVGKAVVNLFDSQPGMSSEQPAHTQSIDATAASGDVTFTGLTPGKYAIFAFYDVNGDGGLTRKSNGVPDEPVVFSNDGALDRNGRMPLFSDAAITVKAGDNKKSLTFPRR